MAPRRFGTPGEGSQVSLFPFLSVLACVIGTLTLLIVALALGEVAADAAVRQAVAEKDRERLEQTQRVAALRDELNEREAALRELDELRAEANRRTRLARAESSASAGPTALAQELRELEERRAELTRRARELEESLDTVAAQLEEPPDRKAAERIILQPLGEAGDFTPFFAECSAAGIRIRTPAGDWSYPMRVEGVEDGPRFRAFLKKVRAIQDGSVIFLIRPDGVPAYDTAVVYAERHAVRHGKLPLPGFGELDFSRF